MSFEIMLQIILSSTKKGSWNNPTDSKRFVNTHKVLVGKDVNKVC